MCSGPGSTSNMVPLDQAPKTFQDLLDPKWKGRIAWHASSFAGAAGFVGSCPHQHGRGSRHELPAGPLAPADHQCGGILPRRARPGDRRRISARPDDLHQPRGDQRPQGRAVGVAEDRADAGRARRDLAAQGCAAPQCGEAADRFPDLGGGPAGAASGRLPAGAARRADHGARDCGRRTASTRRPICAPRRSTATWPAGRRWSRSCFADAVGAAAA